MTRSLVVNASPLILLSRIQRLDLLAALADSVVYPDSVRRELLAGSHRDNAARQVEASSSIRCVRDLEIPEPVRLWDLGAGESQVLAFVLANGGEAVLDDRGARKCARALSIPYTGTLGILVKCRHRGEISAARPVVEALVQAGVRLSPAVVEAALAEVGE